MKSTNLQIATAALLLGCASGGQVSSGGIDPGLSAATLAPLIAAEDSVALAKAILSSCRGAAEKGRCYERQLTPIAADARVKLAMGTLNQLGAMDASVRRTGHVYAHAIGIAAGKGQPDIARAFTQCSETYQSGCYHGVIQAWFSERDSIGAPEANALCAPFRQSESSRWIRFQCVHGMGHGLTMLYAHDLRRGLKGCDLLSDWWDRHSCYSGAFMENIVNVTIPHHPASALAHRRGNPGAEEAHHQQSADTTDAHAGHHMPGMDHATATRFKPVDPADPHYPCSVMEERYLTACYEMQTSVMLYNNKGDIAAAAKACDAAPAAMRTVCYTSLGRDISSYSAQNHDEGIRMCSLGSERYQPWCYYGLVKNFVDLNARPDEGLALCRSVSSPRVKLMCYTAVGEQILLLSPETERRREMCANTETEYLDGCLYGSRVIVVAPPALTEIWRSVR